jgi:hypothetical protein
MIRFDVTPRCARGTVAGFTVRRCGLRWFTTCVLDVLVVRSRWRDTRFRRA